MPNVNRLLMIAGAISIASVGSSIQTFDQEAVALLARSMEKSRSIPFIGILYQKNGPAPAMQVKVEQAKDGSVKVTVLQPMSMGGAVSVDDGKRWKTYLPDKNHIIVQESPKLRSADVDSRLDLAEQNYKFRIDQESVVAGRKAICIIAEPKSNLMPTRYYYVDKETSFLLRMESRTRQGTEVLLDTKMIRFSANVPTPKLPIVGEAPRTIDCPAPVPMRSVTRARETLGFAPIVPQSLPHGFEVQHPQVSGTGGFHFAAIRVSDGLVSGTVYQWSGNPKYMPADFKPRKGDLQAQGVYFRFMGDVPDSAKQRLLELFVREARKGPRAQLEPTRPRASLKGTREDLVRLVMLSIQTSTLEAQTSFLGICAYSGAAALL